MHSFFTRLIPVVLILGLFSLFLFTSCEKEVEKIVQTTVHDTITVTITDSIIVTIISVDTVMADPDSISQGGTITLTTSVTSQSSGTLTNRWFADDGTLSATTGDTVTWKAPDDAGVYVVGVTVSDGEHIGVGSRMVGVGMYAPTVTPYYLGDEACSTCHSGQHGDWEMTGHSHAWAGLMGSSHAASYCFPCHAVGYEGDFGNSGYDEAPIAKFEDVQCENCHAAGSDHVSSQSAADISTDYSSDNCGTCHEGSHHPYMSEWEASPHNYDVATAAHGAGVNGGCQGCHEGYAALERLADEAGLATFYGGAPYGTAARDTMDIKNQNVGCPVCHDSHSADNMGQIRTVADVQLVAANGETPIVTLGGTGKLCMQCHHARRSGDTQIPDGYGHFGPHASPQADVMAGKSAYHGVAPAGFAWATPSHLNVANSCKTCHLNMVEYDGTAAVTGHTFEPTVEACANCHGTITSFDDIVALEDFDGDGNVEGIQSEVGGLMDLLVAALVADGLDTVGTSVSGALGDTLTSTFLQREAGYNYAYILSDKSLGIHNPDYSVQILQQSYEHLTGMPVPSAYILRQEQAVAADW